MEEKAETSVSTNHVGRTTVMQDFREGASSLIVASSLELFGPLVQMVKEDGKFTFQFTKGAAPCTIQLGSSCAVNVTEVHNSELKVTPITIREGGRAGDPVLFGCTGPAGLISVENAAKAQVNFEVVKQEVEQLQRIGAFDRSRDESNATDGSRQTRQQAADAAQLLGDERFWEGMFAEKVDRPDRLLYCPVFDGDCRPGLDARLKYTESLRQFGQCIQLDQTRLEFFPKRCATLCKLMEFERALPDAATYVSLRPNSPTGHCLKGVVHHGLRQYGAAIESFRAGLELSEIVVYDKSRVWTTGTLLRNAMELTISLRASVAEKAKVANQHGVHWRELHQFGRALPCLLEAVELNAQSVGTAHPFYGTCVNNVGACLEAMGNYDEAMKQYSAALRVTERASKGSFRVFLVGGRHMPHGLENGQWEGEEWIPDGFSCDAYVRVELLSTAKEGDELLVHNKAPLASMSRGRDPAHGQAAALLDSQSSRVARQSYQPVWNQVMTLRADRGDAEATVVLMTQSRQRVLLEDRADDLARSVSECAERIREVRGRVGPLEQRVQRLGELGRVKQAELLKAKRQLEDARAELKPIEEHQAQLEGQIRELQERQKVFPDRELGRFTYPLSKLATSLNGQASSAERAWFTIPDGAGGKMRGEDYGLTAIEMEVTWTPEDCEYATRLSNLGNLHRVRGDQHAARTGSVDLRRLEQHYQQAERFLEEASVAMRTAVSAAPPQQDDMLSSALRRRRLTSKPQPTSDEESRWSLERCVVEENLALLSEAMGRPQTFPKGTPETVKAKLEASWKANQAKAVQRLLHVMPVRAAISGSASREYWTLLQSLIHVHMDMENHAAALPLQEEAAALSKVLFGEAAAEATRETATLNQLHIVSGSTQIRALPERGRWEVDTTEAWHWATVEPLSRRVSKAVARTQQQCAEEDELLAEELERMEARKKVMLDPPPITDFTLKPGDDPQLRKAFEAETGTGTGVVKKGMLKSAKVKASKLQTPNTELVRRDIQPWPKPDQHTTFS